MADRLLMITWRDPVRGSEARALEVFNEALGILGRRQQEGAIESFDVALMDPNGLLDGFMAIRGTRAQIDALRADEEFRRNTVDASPIRQHLDAIAARRDVRRLLGGRFRDDKTHPVAREWVRRWGPDRLGAEIPGCSCHAGRCALCN